MNEIDDKELKALCKIGQGKDTCRYLTAGVRGFECQKHRDLAKFIDRRVMAGMMVAQGDNCPGKEKVYGDIQADR